MFRKAIGHKKSSKLFSRHAGAQSAHSMNMRSPGPLDRGGIRL